MTPLALLMHREIEKIASTATLRKAAQQMRDKAVGSLLVEEAGKHIGIVSDVDFVRRAVAEGLDPEQTSVKEVMSFPIVSIDVDRSAKDANDLMAEKHIRHLLVSDGQKTVGIISIRDLVLFFKNRL